MVGCRTLWLALALLIVACGGGASGPASTLETAPETIIEGGMLAPGLPYARFEFSADRPASFECSLDGEVFSRCDSPYVVEGLVWDESHRLEVRARYGNLVDETPADVSFARTAVAYTSLSQTGLFKDIDTRELAPGVMEFAPTYTLWSDGEVKTRWIRLPPGAQVDTSDMDGWLLPEGTQLWKEFRAPDGTLIETRLMEHRGAFGNAQVDDRPDLWVGSFIWRAGDDDADFAADGARNVKGTNFDVPRDDECYLCHQGQPDWALGFSAVQLSREGAPGEITLRSLAERGFLTNPPPAGVDYPVPGNEVERPALGFLHSNCGHCHNPRGLAFQVVDMVLLLSVAERNVQTSNPYLTTVGVPLDSWNPPAGVNISNRIQAGSAIQSAVRYRPSTRVFADQMPPLYTEVVPQNSIAALEAWINSL